MAELSKEKERDTRLSYEYEEYYFHFQTSKSGLVVLCMCDKSFSRRIAFAFLTQIMDDFSSTYGERINSAEDFCTYHPRPSRFNLICFKVFSRDFSQRLRSAMLKYSYDKDIDKVIAVQRRVADLKEIMIKNIKLVDERGERLHILVGKTETLVVVTDKFKKQAEGLSWKFFMQNIKMWIIL